MKHRFLLFATIGLAAIFTSSCSKRLFGINLFVVGEKTSLERQVLGNYAEIGRDLSAYASVRGVAPDGSMKTPPRTTTSQAQVLQALSNRKYNRDDLDTLLSNGAVGEGKDGMLSLTEAEPKAVAQLTPELITKLVQEENTDRATILDRLMKTTPGVREEDRPEVQWILATLNEDLAPAGSRIQAKTGEWKTK